MSRLVIVISLFHFSLILCSQQVSDVQKIELAKSLARNNPDSCELLLDQVLVRFTPLDDSVKAMYFSVRGNYHFFQANYDSALWYYKENLRGRFEDTDQIKAKMANNIGVIYNFNGEQDSAYKYLHQAYLFKKKIDDPSIGGTLNNLGMVSERLGLLEEALNYYKEGIVMKIANGESDKLGTSYLNIGVAWRLLGEYDSAIVYALKAKDSFEQMNDSKGIADALNNLALNYYDQGQVDIAFNYVKRSLAIKKKLKDTHGMMNAYHNLSRYLFGTGNLEQSRMYNDSALYFAQESSSLSEEKNIHLHRSRIDSARGDFREAFESMKSVSSVQYRIYDSEVTNQINELETRYQTREKEQEIEQLSQENKIIQLQAAQTEQRQLILILGVLVLVAVIAIIIIFYRAKTRANQQLQQTNDELEKLNQTKDRLFSIISHDLKSPLSSFHLITKSLTDNWDSLEKDQLKDFLITLRDSSENVRNMMDNLLKWALAQTNQLQYEPQSFNPGEVISAVKNQLQAVATLKKMEINIHHENSLKIEADKAFLEIVIRNLVSNALKYSKVQKKIEVMVESKEGMGVISIQDQGVGMEQQQIEALFSGDMVAHDIQNSSEKGTGLGLLLCKELVHRMNGKLEVSSKINVGTTFRLSFPKAA